MKRIMLALLIAGLPQATAYSSKTTLLSQPRSLSKFSLVRSEHGYDDRSTDLEEYLSTINFEGRILDTLMKKFGGASNGNGLEREDMEFLDLFVTNYEAEASVEDAEGEGGAATATATTIAAHMTTRDRKSVVWSCVILHT